MSKEKSFKLTGEEVLAMTQDLVLKYTGDTFTCRDLRELKQLVYKLERWASSALAKGYDPEAWLVLHRSRQQSIVDDLTRRGVISAIKEAGKILEDNADMLPPRLDDDIQLEALAARLRLITRAFTEF